MPFGCCRTLFLTDVGLDTTCKNHSLRGSLVEVGTCGYKMKHLKKMMASSQFYPFFAWFVLPFKHHQQIVNILKTFKHKCSLFCGKLEGAASVFFFFVSAEEERQFLATQGFG